MVPSLGVDITVVRWSVEIGTSISSALYPAPLTLEARYSAPSLLVRVDTPIRYLSS